MKKTVTILVLLIALKGQAQFINWPTKTGSMTGVSVPTDVSNGSSHGNYKVYLSDFVRYADSAKYATWYQMKRSADSAYTAALATINATFYNRTQSDARYLQSYTESDPTVSSAIKAITSGQITNWNTAFSWGNHAGLYVPLARSITINGITQDLSANRSWTVSGGGSGLSYPYVIKNYLNGYGNWQALNSDSITQGSTNLFLTSSERTNIAANTTTSHTHSNKTTLDNITAAYTTAEQTKLAGIATGATANTGTVTSVAPGYGITGSTITTTGTHGVDTTLIQKKMSAGTGIAISGNTIYATGSASAGTSAKGLPGYYNVEDFGAVAINPSNPDAAPDATDSIQACINYAFTQTKHPVIYLPGMYRLNRNPSRTINGVQHYCQLYIPLTDYVSDGNLDYKSIRFVGANRGNWEAQGIGNFSNPYNGSGFYSTYLETADRDAAVLGYEKGTTASITASSLWGGWNYTTVDIDDIKVIVKTDNAGTPFASYMNGVDLGGITQATISRMMVRTNVPTANTVQPPPGTFGYRSPQTNNHAVSTFGTMYTIGFEKGAILGEHTTGQYLITLGNVYGVWGTSWYGIHIGQLGAENNIRNLGGEVNTYFNIGVFQSENYTNFIGPKWYENEWDIYSTAGSAMKVVIGIAQAHGSATGVLSVSDPEIAVSVGNNEQNVMSIPLNQWTSSTRPLAFRPGVWGLNTTTTKLEYWTGSQWNEIATSGTSSQPYQTEVAADNPIYYNRMSGSGTSQTPTIGTGDITLTGATASQASATASGASVQFAGTSGSYAQLSLNLSAYSNIAFEFWIYLDSDAGDARIGFNHLYPSTSTAGYLNYTPTLDISTNYFAMRGGSGLKEQSSNAMTKGAWHHVVVVYGTSGVTQYLLDGVSQSVSTISGGGNSLTNFNTGTLWLMGIGTSGDANKGRMQDFAVYGGTIPSTSRFQAHYAARNNN